MIRIKRDKCLITPRDISPSSECLEVLGTLNPAAARLPNGDIVLYVRVIERVKGGDRTECYVSPRLIGKEGYKIKIDRFNKKDIESSSGIDIVFKDGTKRLKFISHFRRVFLDKTGFKIKSIDKSPSFYGLSWDGELGVEDPRITKIGDLYVMTYVSLSREGNISTSYSISNDCLSWYRRGIIFGEQDKDVVLFPERINNKYVAFDRPEGNFQFTPPHIWIAYSDNLEFWGDSKAIVFSKKSDWDYTRVGAGPPPIKTKEGWLLIYHVASDSEKLKRQPSFVCNVNQLFKIKKSEKNPVSIYCVGAALFDLKNPKKIISKTRFPLIVPSKKYEEGTFENKRVLFPTGMVLDKNKKDVLIFSGGGDTVVSVKKISIEEILDFLKKD